ncbi:DMT family transporter [Candidatus Acetothermia bacterium]|nr:DMT family transporter [Candidatus Acetothermia bacterium]
MKLKEWGAFWLLGLVWGASFLWIKIALAAVGPFTLVAFRLLFGLIGLLGIMKLQKQSFPRDGKILLAYLVMALFNTALPFVLISWGEVRIDSGLASILNGTTPLFTLIIAHFWLHDEKMTWMRTLGLILGLMGVTVLVSRNVSFEGFQSNIWGQVAVLGAAISYAFAATFSRKYLRGQSPVVQATMVVLFADAMIWIATLAAESPLRLPILPMTWVSLGWLGLLGSCLAYLLYFYLLNTWGATRAAVVIYVFPVIGLLLGTIFLGEAVDGRLVVGSLLIVTSIAVVNLKLSSKAAPVAAPAVAQKKSE